MRIVNHPKNTPNPKESHRKSPPESNTDEGNVWPFGNPRDFAGRGFRPPVRHERWQMIVSDRTVVEDMGFLCMLFCQKRVGILRCLLTCLLTLSLDFDLQSVFWGQKRRWRKASGPPAAMAGINDHHPHCSHYSSLASQIDALKSPTWVWWVICQAAKSHRIFHCNPLQLIEHKWLRSLGHIHVITP